MQIIQERQHHRDTIYLRTYTIGSTGCGYSFNCDEDGEIDVENMNPEARVNYEYCQSGKTNVVRSSSPPGSAKASTAGSRKPSASATTAGKRSISAASPTPAKSAKPTTTKAANASPTVPSGGLRPASTPPTSPEYPNSCVGESDLLGLVS